MNKVKIIAISCWILYFLIFQTETKAGSFGEVKEKMSQADYLELVREIPISQIGIISSGGRSDIKEYGMTVKEYDELIVIRVFKTPYSEKEAVDKKAILSKEEYEELWKRLEKLNIWSLKDVREPGYLDAFEHDLIFSRNDRNHQIHTTSLEPIQGIIDPLNELSKKKLGITLY